MQYSVPRTKSQFATKGFKADTSLEDFHCVWISRSLIHINTMVKLHSVRFEYISMCDIADLMVQELQCRKSCVVVYMHGVMTWTLAPLINM